LRARHSPWPFFLPLFTNHRKYVFSEDEMRRPTPQIRSTLWVCKSHTGSNAQEGGSAHE
jgi:hypothetical protein